MIAKKMIDLLDQFSALLARGRTVTTLQGVHVSEKYDNLDPLILERWDDVCGLIEAHRNLQHRIEKVIEAVKDRLDRWAAPIGYVFDVNTMESEIYARRTAWVDRQEEPPFYFVVGGFCPKGFHRVDADYPYLWVCADNQDGFCVTEPERKVFAEALRKALGSQAPEWTAKDVDDSVAPLGRYLTQYDNAARVHLISDADSLFAFCINHFPTLFKLEPVIQRGLGKLALHRRGIKLV